MSKVGPTVVNTLWHYFHAVLFRLFLQRETFRLRRLGRVVPNYIDRLIWRLPSEAEAWVNLICFLDTAERILLVDIGANVGEISKGFRNLFPNSSIIAFEPTMEAFTALKSFLETIRNCWPKM